MPGYEDILQTYEAVSVTSAQMVDAAKNSDWDRLIALEQDCRDLVARLKRIDDGSPRPDAPYTQRKVALIRKVLADDAEIRRYTEPWMERLQALLGSARHEQRLQRAYDAGG
jgi:flagellar protein FliT